MSSFKRICASVLVIGALASGTAAAHGVRWGVNIGIPLFPPAWYYPPPAYYYPPPVVAAPAPPVYVERREAQAAPSPPSEYYWYYCPDSQAYYPYVKECGSPWQRVSPRPPGT